MYKKEHGGRESSIIATNSYLFLSTHSSTARRYLGSCSCSGALRIQSWSIVFNRIQCSEGSVSELFMELQRSASELYCARDLNGALHQLNGDTVVRNSSTRGWELDSTLSRSSIILHLNSHTPWLALSSSFMLLTLLVPPPKHVHQIDWEIERRREGKKRPDVR